MERTVCFLCLLKFLNVAKLCCSVEKKFKVFQFTETLSRNFDGKLFSICTTARRNCNGDASQWHEVFRCFLTLLINFNEGFCHRVQYSSSCVIRSLILSLPKGLISSRLMPLLGYINTQHMAWIFLGMEIVLLHSITVFVSKSRYNVQWNLQIKDTFGTDIVVPCREVSTMWKFSNVIK